MGPLQGFKIIEIAGIGPSQFCGMLLADMGAEILRIDKPRQAADSLTVPAKFNLMNRSRRTIMIDLKKSDGVELVLALCRSADAFFEGFRPGVIERIGLGPDDCMRQNKSLVYGRMTGWGQDGPLAQVAGHDGNYIALVGALAAIGENKSLPAIPLNLIGDFGAGGAYLAIGILAALLEASRSGTGQVVDAAMTDGTASLMTLFFGLHAAGMWKEERGANFLDGAAPFYRTYETKDREAVVVCALEGRFFSELLKVLSIEDIDLDSQYDRNSWPAQAARIEAAFMTRTREEWCELFDGTDACFAPVLSMSEAVEHKHNKERETFVEVDGIVQPAPAPRFSRSNSQIRNPPLASGKPDSGLLREWGVGQDQIDRLIDNSLIEP
jgi:alpha-methylacyl-CoA racemase